MGIDKKQREIMNIEAQITRIQNAMKIDAEGEFEPDQNLIKKLKTLNKKLRKLKGK